MKTLIELHRELNKLILQNTKHYKGWPGVNLWFGANIPQHLCDRIWEWQKAHPWHFPRQYTIEEMEEIIDYNRI